MKQIKLTEPWGGFKKGKVLDVLGPAEDLRKGAVDGKRAALLQEQGRAAEATETGQAGTSAHRSGRKK
jgi:hypothetical protein